jgi:hypothetical protein
MVSLTGMLGDHPSTDIKGFREYAKSLAIPHVSEAIRDVESDVGPTLIGFPASVRRHYEQLTAFPRDSSSSGMPCAASNPVYGQGMTVAALEALTLRSHLQRGSLPTAKRFFTDISKVIDAPRGISADGDLAWPEVEGERTRMVKIMNAYMAKLMYGMLFDSRLTGALYASRGPHRPAASAAAAGPGL